MLNDVIIRYASVPDTENSEHFFIEQYEVQIISAIRRVLTLSTVYDPVVLSVNIVYTLITSGVITDRASLGKLMQMVKPLDENVDNSKTILRIEQIKIQVMAKLFLLCFLPDSKLQGPIRSEMTSIVQQNADYWRAKWCVRIRKALMEQKDANEYALYLLVAMALVNQEQVSKKEEPNYELQQLVLIVGGIMSALNELLADQQENPSLLTCLIALRLCEPFVQFIPGERVLDDFVEYVLHVLDVLLQSPLMQKSSKLRDQLYNESIELFTGILPFVKMAREEGKTIATLQPKQVRNKVTVRKESKEKKGRSVEKEKEKEKENEDEYEYVSEYCYESYYSYETDDEEEEKKEAMEKKASKSQKEVEEKEPKEEEKKEEEQREVKPEVKPEVKVNEEKEVKVNEEKEVKVESEEKPKEEVKEEPKEAEVQEEPKEAEVQEEPKEAEVQEEVVKEELKEELKEEPQKEEVKEEPKQEPEEKPEEDSKDNIRSTALARSEAKLEVDEHLWDSDDEPVKPSRTSRRSRRATKPVKEEPKEMPKEEVKEEPKEEPKEESKEETKEEVKKDSKDNIRSTALARSETKLEVDEHLWDSDDEPAKPARTSRRSRRATSRPMYRIVEESPLGAAPPDSEESSDDESPRRTRSRVGRGKKLESFEASWDNEEEEGAGENWEDSNADESWGFDDETPKKNETPKKGDEVQKEEEPKKVDEVQKEEESKKEETPKREETPIKKEETPIKKEETPIKKEETPLPSSSSSPFIADPLQGNPLSLFATPPLSSSSSSSSSLFWSILHVCDLLLTAAPSYLPCSRAIRSCLALFPDRPDVRSFFAGRLFDLLKSHELPASESRVLLALLTDLAAPDLPLRKSLLDSIVETALSLLSQPDKLPLIAQLLQLAHALYALHTEPWMLQHFVVLFHAFANAAAATAERAAFVLSAFVELAPKLKIDHLRFFIATCAVEVIGMVVPRVNEFGKKELSALVQFAALCYGKTEKKNEVVDLVIRLNALALDRSVALQPMDVSKAVEDPEITKINGMIGEILFVVATANADRMKITIQQLPAASATNLQNQLRKTVQVKQMESSAARRRNANRMPVKLDASKFT